MGCSINRTAPFHRARQPRIAVKRLKLPVTCTKRLVDLVHPVVFKFNTSRHSLVVSGEDDIRPRR